MVNSKGLGGKLKKVIASLCAVSSVGGAALQNASAGNSICFSVADSLNSKVSETGIALLDSMVDVQKEGEDEGDRRFLGCLRVDIGSEEGLSLTNSEASRLTTFGVKGVGMTGYNAGANSVDMVNSRIFVVRFPSRGVLEFSLAYISQDTQETAVAPLRFSVELPCAVWLKLFRSSKLNSVLGTLADNQTPAGVRAFLRQFCIASGLVREDGGSEFLPELLKCFEAGNDETASLRASVLVFEYLAKAFKDIPFFADVDDLKAQIAKLSSENDTLKSKEVVASVGANAMGQLLDKYGLKAVGDDTSNSLFGKVSSSISADLQKVNDALSAANSAKAALEARRTWKSLLPLGIILGAGIAAPAAGFVVSQAQEEALKKAKADRKNVVSRRPNPTGNVNRSVKPKLIPGKNIKKTVKK